MIGRGTRLSEDIFGPSKDKACFYIFDWCGNFDYFDNHPDGHEAPVSQSLTERLFCLRSEIAFHLQHQKYQEDEYCKSLHDEIKALLYEQVQALSDSHISVRMKWESVSHFKEKESWTYISDHKEHTTCEVDCRKVGRNGHVTTGSSQNGDYQRSSFRCGMAECFVAMA